MLADRSGLARRQVVESSCGEESWDIDHGLERRRLPAECLLDESSLVAALGVPALVNHRQGQPVQPFARAGVYWPRVIIEEVAE